MDKRRLIIEIVSDVICPWCYIGKRRLEKALPLIGALLADVEVEIRWLPFQLNPDMPAAGVPRQEYRKAKFGSLERAKTLDARVASEGSGEGIAFAFDRIERTPNTVRAHQLIELAQRQGVGNPVVDALFRAYFEEARDVGDAAVLEDIAARCGVRDWPQAADAPTVAQLEEDMRGLGISAVPTFIFDRRTGVSGAHPPESLAAAMQQALGKVEAGV
jgi:predicted DsbA family dithiol-disulfide isomerase